MTVSSDPNSDPQQGDLFSSQPADGQEESAGTAPPETARSAGRSESTTKSDINGSASRKTQPKSDIKSVINEFKKVIAPLESLTKIKLGVHDSSTKLEKALEGIGNSATFAGAIDDLKSQLARALEG